MKAIRNKIKKATSTPKGRIIFFTLLLLIVVAIGGALLYWTIYRKQIIRQKLESTIREKSQGLYQIKYDELKLDEVAGNLTVVNLTLQFDSLRYVAMRGSDREPPTLLRIQIPQLSVSGVKTPRALIDKEIVGRKLTISSPSIEILYTNSGKDSTRTTPTREVYEQILGQLNLIRIDSVDITNAVISTRNLRGSRKNIELNGTDIHLVDVQVDSIANADKTRILFARQIETLTRSVQWVSDNGMYKYSADSIWMQSRTGNVTITRFSIDPQLPEQAFVNKLPFQDDRFDFTLKNIGIHHLDMNKLFDEQVQIDSIIVATSSFKIYRDLGLRRDKKSRLYTYPHQVVAKIAIPVNVKKLVLQNAYVEYKERNAKTREAGRVRFDNTYAVISNMTNDRNAADRTMNVAISTRFLNKAPLHIDWTFYLFDPDGRFRVKGRLGTIAATDVNELSVPMGPARMEKGTIKSLDFDLTGYNRSMKGEVKMLYDDLKVSVLEKDDDTHKLEKKKLASLAANIIIKNSNPSGKKDEPRIANPEFERDINRSIFHLSWKTLFKGIKETVGINK